MAKFAKYQQVTHTLPGSPTMLVMGYEAVPAGGVQTTPYCTWFDKNNVYRGADFDEALLTAVPPATTPATPSLAAVSGVASSGVVPSTAA